MQFVNTNAIFCNVRTKKWAPISGSPGGETSVLASGDRFCRHCRIRTGDLLMFHSAVGPIRLQNPVGMRRSVR